MPDTFARYEALVDTGAIEFDAAQAAVASTLGELNEALANHRLKRKSSALGWLFSRGKPTTPPRGLYLWGEVGRGKTMLMDLFMVGSPVRRKRRAHFHEFMADVHERIGEHRRKVKTGEAKGDDPIPPVAEAIAEEAWLLCFDEFAVTDIADAMILGRLFTALFAEGVVVVATSNVEPDRLYEGGLNRALFTPFIAILKERMAVTKLEARADFRLEKLVGRPVWITAGGEVADAAMDEAFHRLSGEERGEATTLPVQGRELVVPAQAHRVARFAFDDLCKKALGANDYLAIAHAFHTVLIDRIPVMRGLETRNEAKRFITLIDALYDNRVKLVASAGAEPAGLYLAEDGREAFEFQRTASRLIEMRSEDYLALPHGRPQAVSGESTGLVET